MHPVHDAVVRFITADAGRFDDLALAVFAHQFETIPSYRCYCERRAASPATVKTWRDVPPVPVAAFKQSDLSCAPPQRVFLTTGTSRGSAQRGRHALPDPRLYRASAVGGLRRFLFPDVIRIQIVSLIPPPEAAPDSSLSQMVDWAIDEFGTRDGSPPSVYAASSTGIDHVACVEALRASERRGNLICLMTTTAALVHLLDYCSAEGLTFRLPHGCRLMDTGGAKGMLRHLSRKGLLQACWNTFALPGYFCANEYGMAELSSQFYDNVISNRVTGRFAHRALQAPPWARVRVLDPETLDDVPTAEPGLLCLYDLANAGTVMVVLTEDIGRAVTSGDPSDGFEVCGRVRGAEARGCSLSAAEWQRAV